MQLTIFYDGFCPLCRIEMDKLRSLDAHHQLAFEDIQDSQFSQRFPALNWQDLDNRLHAMRPDGSLVTGLDVTHLAWKLVGRGWMIAPLRWPLVKPIADVCYLFFAKHRYKISYWLTGQKRGCATCEVVDKK